MQLSNLPWALTLPVLTQHCMLTQHCIFKTTFASVNTTSYVNTTFASINTTLHVNTTFACVNTALCAAQHCSQLTAQHCPRLLTTCNRLCVFTRVHENSCMNDLMNWSYLISLTQLVVRVLYNTLVIVRDYYNTQINVFQIYYICGDSYDSPCSLTWWSSEQIAIHCSPFFHQC